MSPILSEIREAYGRMGIEVEGIATYGTYYRLRCGRCSASLGSVGDRPGLPARLLMTSSSFMPAVCWVASVDTKWSELTR